MRKRTTSRRKTTGAKHHTRRRHTTRTHTVRRRRTTRHKGMLSEFFNPGQAAEAAKVVLEGAAGGVGAHFLNKVLPSSINPAQKAIITVGAGFVSAAMLKRPILGAGMAAIGVMNLLTETKLLADDTGDFASGMDSLPMVLNENAYPLSDGMYLSDNMYLNDGMYLSNDFESDGTGYDVGYYPEFGGV
jgi:hypothetical protein